MLDINNIFKKRAGEWGSNSRNALLAHVYSLGQILGRIKERLEQETYKINQNIYNKRTATKKQ